MAKVQRAAVGAAAVLTLLAGCGSVGSGGPAAPTSTPTSAAPRGSTDGKKVVDSFKYNLYTHCGIRFAKFAHRTWATEPRSDGSGNPPMGWDNPVQAGKMYLLADDVAVFRASGLPDLRFHPTRAEPRICA